MARNAFSSQRTQCQIDQPEEKSIKERQEGQEDAEKSAPSAAIPAVPTVPTAALLSCASCSIWSTVPAADTPTGSTTASTGGSPRRTQCYEDGKATKSLRGEVQCLAQCGDQSGFQYHRITGVCSDVGGSTSTARTSNCGRSLRSSWIRSEEGRSSQAGTLPDAQHMAELLSRLCQEMARIHPRFPTTRNQSAHPDQPNQGDLPDSPWTLRAIEGGQSRNRLGSPDYLRRRSHGHRGQGLERRPCRQHTRDLEQHARDLRDPQNQSPDLAGRRKRLQEDQAFGRDCTFDAAFWPARCVGQQDSHLGLLTATGEEWSSCLVQKWTHSLWADPQSICEWQAIWNASLLSFELGTFTEMGSAGCSVPTKHISKAHGIDVRFDPLIQVAIGMEEDISFSSTWCTHQQLQSWESKPWGMDPLTRAYSHTRVFAGLHPHLEPPGDWAHHDRFPQNRPQDLPHDAPPWMQKSFRLLFADRAMEYEDQQPEVVLQTWYLREANHRTCKMPRMIALNMDFYNWEQQLLRLWEDLIAIGADTQFYIVSPDPPRTSMQSFHAHLLIVQNRRLEVPILTTMLWQSQNHDFLFQNALFVPLELHFEVLQHRTDIVQQCHALHCTWWKGPNRIYDNILPRVLPGDGVQILLHDPEQPYREAPRFPTVEWPYTEPPPPWAEPEVFFRHADEQDEDATLLTQLQASIKPGLPDQMPTTELIRASAFYDKENQDPNSDLQAACTFSPTTKRLSQSEDVTQRPLRTALSSLNFDRDAVAAPKANVPHSQMRLLPEIELPPIRDLPEGEPQVPQRRPIWTYPAWIQELWSTLHRYGIAEREEEGPSIQIVTWYIHHDLHRRCYRPRLLRLHDLCETWEPAIRRLWADHVDPHLPIDFFKVFPTPPRLSEQPIAHLLLSQGAVEEKAVLITSLWATQIPNLYGLTHVATYLPEQISAQEVIDSSDAAAHAVPEPSKYGPSMSSLCCQFAHHPGRKGPL